MSTVWRPLLTLLLLGAVAFSNVPAFDLVWDDRHFLLYSEALNHGSAGALFTSDFGLDGAGSGYYRPLVTFTLFVERRVFGTSPGGYHVMNLVYHLAATLAVAWVGTGLLASRTGGWLAGAAFAVHPVHTESVAFVSGRTDLLAALFFVLAFGCYTRWRQDGRAWRLWLSLLAFAAALCSKEPAIVLPGVLLAWELSRAGDERLRRSGMLIAGQLLPFALVAAAYLAVRAMVLGSVAGLPRGSEPLTTRAAEGVRALGRYLLLLVAPYPSTPDYVLDPPAGWTAWPTVLSAAALAALALVVARAWRRGSPLAGLLGVWFILTLLPATPFVPWGPVQMAERFLYLPSVALALLVGWLGARWIPSPGALDGRLGTRTALVVTGAAALLLVAVGLTLYRNEDWRDDERLFTRMASSAPRSWKAPVNLGHLYQQRDELLPAAAEFRKALELRPDLPAALMGLAVVESRLGIHEDAVRLGRRALGLAPGSDLMDLQLALILGNSGDHPGAARHLAEAVRKSPWRVDARYHLALALARAGREAEARAALDEADALARRLRGPAAAQDATAGLARAALARGAAR